MVTARAEVRDVPVTLAAVGTVEAISTVELRAQVSGQVEQILFQPGQEVKKGQPLFELDRRPLDAAVRQAEAVVAKDEAQTKDAGLQRQRAEDLFNRGLIPRDQYDTQSATAAALEATLAADRAQLDQARLNRQYARIASPMDGRTGALQVHVGDVIRTGDTTPLVTINQLAPIYVSFAVPARYLLDIRRYSAESPLKVSVTGQGSSAPGARRDDAFSTTPPIDTAPTGTSGRTNASPVGTAGAPMSAPSGEGTVTFIDNAVDASTATINLKATFPNRDRALWPGLFVQTSLQLTTQKDAVVVPATAVQSAQQGQYVYVVQHDHTVEMRNVTLDRQQGDNAIIAEGLIGGEEVVTQGQLRLSPGAHVTTAGATTPGTNDPHSNTPGTEPTS